jgi:acetyltransferase-like isoleucine patch superfamily enzyme
MGSGSRIERSVDISVTKNVSIGNNSILYKQICLYPSQDGKFSMGDNSHIAPFGYLLIDKNSISIGNDVAIGPFCTMICHSNSITGESDTFAKNYEDGDIQIGNNVFIGAQCTLLPGSIIKDNVVVAANSVVKGTLESNSVYGGSPVKLIKSIDA